MESVGAVHSMDFSASYLCWGMFLRGSSISIKQLLLNIMDEVHDFSVGRTMAASSSFQGELSQRSVRFEAVRWVGALWRRRPHYGTASDLLVCFVAIPSDCDLLISVEQATDVMPTNSHCHR